MITKIRDSMVRDDGEDIMKKLLIAALAVMTAMSLAACSQPAAGTTTAATTTTATAADETTAAETTTTAAETTAEATDAETTPAETTAEAATTAGGETTPAAAAGEITPVATTLEAPAKIGDWVETKLYSAQDKDYHTVYFRITDIVRDSATVQAAIDAYNNADHLRTFEPLENDDLEYCLIQYETAFPADFPQAEWGITSVDVNFSITTVEGGGIKANGLSYIGLSSVYDITESPEINEFYAGQTFTDGQALFVMVKGVSDYVVETYYFEGEDDDSEKISAYVAGQ